MSLNRSLSPSKMKRLTENSNPPTDKCNAWIKGSNQTKMCKREAGWGTDHPGEGRCRQHGGSEGRPGAAAETKSRYSSSITYRPIRELLKKYEEDPEPMNLLPEVLLLRAITTDFVNRYVYHLEMADKWHAVSTRNFLNAMDRWKRDVRLWAQKQGPNPEYRAKVAQTVQDIDFTKAPAMPNPWNYVVPSSRMPDISAAAKIAAEVGNMVEKVQRMANTAPITLETLDKLLERLGSELVLTLQEEVSDETLRAAILSRFEQRWAGVDIQGGVPARRSYPGTPAQAN